MELQSVTAARNAYAWASKDNIENMKDGIGTKFMSSGQSTKDSFRKDIR